MNTRKLITATSLLVGLAACTSTNPDNVETLPITTATTAPPDALNDGITDQHELVTIRASAPTMAKWTDTEIQATATKACEAVQAFPKREDFVAAMVNVLPPADQEAFMEQVSWTTAFACSEAVNGW